MTATLLVGAVVAVVVAGAAGFAIYRASGDSGSAAAPATHAALPPPAKTTASVRPPTRFSWSLETLMEKLDHIRLRVGDER